MPKIFLSPERRPAPHGKYWGMNVYEHDVCCEIAKTMKPILERNGFDVLIAPPGWSMGQRADYANANVFDYYMCIHTNASGNGKAEGTATGAECLYYNDAASINANKIIYKELTDLYPSKRGIKDYSQFAENNLTKMVSCYPEIAFHDNGNDARWIVANKAQIAGALCKGICGYFGVKYNETPTAPTQPDDSKDKRIAELTAENERLRVQLADTDTLRRTAVQNLADMAAKIIADVSKYTA